MLLLTFTRRAAARDAPARARHRARGARATRSATRRRRCCSGWSGPALFTRSATGCCATMRATCKLEPVVHRDRPGRFRRSAGRAAHRSSGFAAKEQRFPRKDTCLAIYSWRVNTQKNLHDTLEQQFPWCKDWEEDLTQAVSRLRRAQAALRAARLRRSAALLAHDDGRADGWRSTSAPTSITCWSMSTRTPTSCRPRSCMR